jgi:hypothetical protein
MVTMMHSDGPQSCGTGSTRTRSFESGDRTLVKIQPMWRQSTGRVCQSSKPKSATRLLAKISQTLMIVEPRPAAPDNR